MLKEDIPRSHWYGNHLAETQYVSGYKDGEPIYEIAYIAESDHAEVYTYYTIHLIDPFHKE